jgi:hypothetical protein
MKEQRNTNWYLETWLPRKCVTALNNSPAILTMALTLQLFILFFFFFFFLKVLITNRYEIVWLFTYYFFSYLEGKEHKGWVCLLHCVYLAESITHEMLNKCFLKEWMLWLQNRKYQANVLIQVVKSIQNQAERPGNS